MFAYRKKCQKALHRCGKGPQNPQDFKKGDYSLLTQKDRPRDAPASKNVKAGIEYLPSSDYITL